MVQQIPQTGLCATEKKLREHRTSHFDLRTGFTLIELLVVVAVISLLVSILLPSLTKAKELARQVVCQNKLHATGIILYYYAQDYDGQVYLTPDYATWQPYCLKACLDPYLDGPWTEYFHCPSAEGKPDRSLSDGLDYGGSVSPEDWSSTFAHRIPVKLEDYTDRVMVCDRFWAWMRPVQVLWHETGVNLLWGDGSANWFSDDGYLLSLNLAGDGGYWITCNAFDWLTQDGR